MKRAIAHAQTWWLRACVAVVVVLAIVPNPWWVMAVPAALLALGFVRSPWDCDRTPVEVEAPVQGRWVALNSPATNVPSHGLIAYGQAFAVDILRASGATKPRTVGWSLSSKAADSYPSFGAPVHAVADGEVVAVERGQRDHRDRSTWPALIYLFIVEAFFRELGGPRFILGNHVILDHGDGVYSAYAHLRRGSALVRPGQRVTAGEPLGEVGNSGNTTEPHLHFQLMDDAHLTAAAGIPFRWRDIEMRPGDTDASYASRPVSSAIEPGLPADGQVFRASTVEA